MEELKCSKRCWICKLEKSLDQFYSDKSRPDLKSYRCKKCDGERKRYRKKSKEYYRSYHSKKLPKFKADVRAAANAALKKGIIKKYPCKYEKDNCKGRIEMHHPDYSKPLEVIFLCKRHHTFIHLNRTPANSGENI